MYVCVNQFVVKFRVQINISMYMPLIIVVCGSHGFSRGVCMMTHWNLGMTCFNTF